MEATRGELDKERAARQAAEECCETLEGDKEALRAELARVAARDAADATIICM